MSGQTIATCGGYEMIEVGPRIYFIDRGTGGYAIALFVLGLLTAIASVNGVLQIAMGNLMAGLIIGAVGAVFGAVFALVLRARRARLGLRWDANAPLAFIDRETGSAHDGSGQALAPLAHVSFGPEFQMTSSSAALAMKLPQGRSSSREAARSLGPSTTSPMRCGRGAFGLEAWYVSAMGLLTFGLNLTLDGCCDHREGIADEELHDYFTEQMDAAGAMLWGRVTYELMESAWPAIARDGNAPPAMLEWARKLEAKPKYVVSASRSDFPWSNTVRLEGDLREAVTQLKEKTPQGVLVGSPALGAALERLGLIDEYRLMIHPVIAGHGPTLFQGLDASRRLELVSTRRLKSGQMAMHYRSTMSTRSTTKLWSTTS